MSNLKQRINDDVKTAMRNKDKDRLVTLRMITAAIKQKEVDERLAHDGANLVEELVENEGRTKRVLTAKFPDGSMARVPQSLWIDYSLFDRV